MEIYCGNFRLCHHPTTWSSFGRNQFTDAKLILPSHGNIPEKQKIVQSFHQLPSAWPRIPGSRFSDETSGKTSIYGNGLLYREVCLHHCQCSFTRVLWKKAESSRKHVPLYSRALTTGLKASKCPFSQEFVCFCQRCIAFGKLWPSCLTHCSKLFSRENHE